MNGLRTTEHAVARLAQRALSPEDVDLILSFGTEVPDGYFMRDADTRQVVDALRGMIQKIERTRGKFVVTAGDRIVTAYPASRRKQRHLLRRNP